MARQYAKTAAVRRSILEACSAAFGESGFHGVSMAGIARRAGISHTGLVHHFPRKEDLLTAILALQDERTAEQMHAGGVSAAADPVDVLREMAVTLVDREPEVGIVELSAVLSGEATSLSHPAHGYFQGRYRDIRRYVGRQFARLADEGRLSSSLDADQLAALLIAGTEGLHQQWLYERDDTVSVPVIIEGLLAAFVPELRVAGPPRAPEAPGGAQRTGV
jgi:AcrR family transcriptional regulator